jgi:POT family proton-dependent oligopeptide transporter
MSQPSPLSPPRSSLFGHPAGLYTLFFAEMWERFSYYGMRALLIFYMTKGFLGYGDGDAYTVYGAYTALVYMTPFFGGLLADRLLGARKAVVFGGLLMAAGQAVLMVPQAFGFYAGLALLIVGNGFFKPNISVIVGSLYAQYPGRRDGGFTIFYMGVNLGAAMSPLLCGYIGEIYGWHYGFGLATVGMLAGLAVFVLPRLATGLTILSAATIAACGLLWFHPVELLTTLINVFVAAALMAAAIVAAIALYRGGLPTGAGASPYPERLRRSLAGFLTVEMAVYLGAILLIPLFLLLVSGGATLRAEGRPLVLIADSTIRPLEASASLPARIAAICLKEVSKPAGVVLVLAGFLAFGYLIIETFRLEKLSRHRMYVVLVLTFFSMLFWAFFEQAGSSLNNFTDRNVHRVLQSTTVRTITDADVGKTISLEPTQEQLGFHNGKQMFTLTALNELRREHGDGKGLKIDWLLAPDNVGMRIARRADEIPASLFQAANPIYILLLGLVFTAAWGWLGARGLEPSTPLKFALGLLQLALGFAVFWLGAQMADSRGLVAMGWLLLGYLLHTTGELCLSPVGLAMITKLSPAYLVSTVMGGWFLATAASQFLAGIIAQFTRVGQAGAEAKWIPPPQETLAMYANVYGLIAIAAMASALICFALVPLLKTWMHEGEETAP